jgi:hypothetical protein
VDQIKPGLEVVLARLKELAVDEVRVEFGVILGAEAGAVIAKGSAEAHFAVTLAWKKPGGAPGAAGHCGVVAAMPIRAGLAMVLPATRRTP